MLKLILQLTAVILLLVMSVWIFIHLLPWAIAILALLALAIRAYHWWIGKNGGTPPCWFGPRGKEA